MDYSKLSDFEINKRVLAIKSGIKPLGYAHNADERSAGILDVSNSYHWFDFCNNAEDAWPIIVANNISILSCRNGLWHADCQAYWVDGVEWQVDGQINQNPLRAAMTAFLMMQESEG